MTSVSGGLPGLPIGTVSIVTAWAIVGMAAAKYRTSPVLTHSARPKDSCVVFEVRPAAAGVAWSGDRATTARRWWARHKPNAAAASMNVDGSGTANLTRKASELPALGPPRLPI